MHSRKSYRYSYEDRRHIQRNIFLVVITLLIVMVLFSLISGYLLRPVSVQNENMFPEINAKDYLLMSPIAVYQDLSRGEHSYTAYAKVRGMPVIVRPFASSTLSTGKLILDTVLGFFSFQQYRPFSEHNKTQPRVYARRLVGFPGDEIFMKDFVLYVKPAGETHFLTEFELTAYDYNIHVDTIPFNWSSDMPFSGSIDPFVVKENEFFVLCDNRTGGIDSRFWGTLPQSAIVGKLILRCWPFSQFGRF